MDGGGCLLALSKVLACCGFESFKFRCASEFDVSNVVLGSHTVVVGDSYDFDLISVRDGCIVHSGVAELKKKVERDRDQTRCVRIFRFY